MALLPDSFPGSYSPCAPTQSDPRGMRLTTCATPLQTLPSSRGLRSRPDPEWVLMASSSARRDRPLLLHPQLKAQEHRWWYRWLRFLRGRDPSGPDSGQSSPGRTLRGLFRLGGGHSAPLPPWLALGCPGGTSCPPLRPSTAVCPRPHTLCNLLLPLFFFFFFKLQSFIGFC